MIGVFTLPRTQVSPLLGFTKYSYLNDSKYMLQLKGGFYHDGRFALGLTDDQKSDLVKYLKSLGGQ